MTKELEKQIHELTEQIYREGYLEGVRNTAKEYVPELKRTYKDGLNDAWKCAKQIVLPPDDGGLFTETLENIFGTRSVQKVLKSSTPSKAIAKIEEYEKKRKQCDNCKHLHEIDNPYCGECYSDDNYYRNFEQKQINDESSNMITSMCEYCMYYAPNMIATGPCLNGESIAYSNTPQQRCKAYETRKDKDIREMLMNLMSTDHSLTNGEVLRFVFPNSYYEVRAQVVIFEFGGVRRELPIGWWNAPYYESKVIKCCDNCRYSTSPELRETFCFGCKEANGWAPRRKGVDDAVSN